MKKIGITGSSGFLGWHLRAFLSTLKDLEILECDKDCFNNSSKLEEFVSNCDVIVHLAGVNRGDDKDVYEINVDLAKKLIEVLKKTSSTPNVIFSSSTHIDRDTAYGGAKKETSELLANWGKEAGAEVTSLILPHIFGEFAKPFYNSAVATFCYQLASGEKSEINRDGKVSLVYVQDVAKIIYDFIKNPRTENFYIKGQDMSMGDLYDLLTSLKEEYYKDIVPNLDNKLHLNIFNTFRSYIVDSFYPRELVLHSDERGSLFEMTKERTGGQTFISTTKSGKTRGDHYHFRKIERFCVVEGEAEIKIRKLFTDDVKTYKVSGDKPVYIDMPTFYTHNITNVGEKDLITAFWVNEIFNPDDPDTFYIKV